MGVLRDRLALPREARLLRAQRGGPQLDQADVGGGLVADTQLDEVARDELPGGQVGDLHSVAGSAAKIEGQEQRYILSGEKQKLLRQQSGRQQLDQADLSRGLVTDAQLDKVPRGCCAVRPMPHKLLCIYEAYPWYSDLIDHASLPDGVRRFKLISRGWEF
jgi:hypothetical protein